MKIFFRPGNWSQFTVSLLSFMIGVFPSFVYALPQGGVVQGGDATITETQPGSLHIDQSTDRAIIDWTSFDIGSQEQVNFHMPSSGSVNLSRVTGGSASSIFGSLTSNGTLMLINPNGILFGRGSQIDVHGLLATTTDIRNEDFMAGRYNFDLASPYNTSIVHRGNLSIGQGGLAAFVAPGVVNEGVINARLGRVNLSSGKKFTLDLYGDQLINLDLGSAVDGTVTGAEGQSLTSLVDNRGEIFADGGVITLDARAAGSVVDRVINMSGLAQARSVVEKNGEIYLLGGDTGEVHVSGTLDAAGYDSGLTGGTIHVLGDRVGLFDRARVDVSGDTGGGTLLFGGDYQGQGLIPTATETFVGRETEILADAISRGNGGRLIFWADRRTRFFGRVRSRGGESSGDGGFVEVSGREELVFDGAVNTSAPNGEFGTLLLDPGDIEILDGNGGNSTDGSETVSTSGTVTFSISENSLEALSASTNVELFAKNHIFLRDLTDNNLNLKQGSGGHVRITAETGRIQFDDANDQITTQGADIILRAGQDMVLGKLNTNGGDVHLLSGEGGTLSLGTATGGISIDNSELSNITANNLFIGGSVSGERSKTVLADGVSGITGLTGGITLNALNEEGLVGGSAAKGAISFGSQASNFSSGLTLNANSSTIINSSINSTGNFHIVGTGPLTVANGVMLTSTTGSLNMVPAINALGSLALNAGNGITLSDNLTTAGLAALNADLDNNGTGAFNLASGKTINTGGNALSLITGTWNLTGSINLGSAGFTLVASNGQSIGLGSGAGDVQLTTANLSQVTAGSFVIGNGTGAVNVDGVNLLEGLTLNGSAITFSGSDSAFANLIANGPIQINGVNLASTGGILDFNGAVTLAGGPVQVTTGTNDIFFHSTIDGGQALTLNSGAGTIHLDGNVGGTTKLSSLSATGSTTLSGVSINTSNGNVTFNNSVTLDTGAVSINTDSGGGDITFAGTVDGAQDLVLNSGTGTIHLDGNVGGTTKLSSLSATGSTTLSGVLINTSNGNVTFNNDVTLDTGAVSINTDSGGGDITFGGTVDGAQDLVLNSGTGTIRLDGNVGSTTKLSSLSAAGSTTLSGVLINTSNGNVTFNDDVTLDTGAVVVNSDSGDITFGGTVDGAQDLALDSGTGAIRLNGSAGSSTALASLLLDGATTIDGSLVNITGSLTANQDLTVNNASILNAGNGIALNGNVSTTGSTTFNADSDSDGSGTFSLASGKTLAAGSDVTLVADDVNLTGNINSSGNVTMRVSDGGSVGLGDANCGSACGMSLSGAELENIASNNLTVENTSAGGVFVDNVTAANSNNISGTTTLSSGGGVTVDGPASTFNALAIDAAGKVTVNTNLSTDTGALSVSGNDLVLSADLSSAGDLSLTSVMALSDSVFTGNLTAVGTALFRTTGAGRNISITRNHTIGGSWRFFTDSGNVSFDQTGPLAIGSSSIGGNFTVATNDDIFISGLTINTGGGSLVSLTTTGGGVFDGGGSFAFDIDNPNGTLFIRAVEGVGTPTDFLETRVASVDIINTTSGGIHLFEHDSLNILNIDQQVLGTDVLISYSGFVSGEGNVILNGGQLILTNRNSTGTIVGNTGKTLGNLSLERTVNNLTEVETFFGFGEFFEKDITPGAGASQENAFSSPYVTDVFSKKYRLLALRDPRGIEPLYRKLVGWNSFWRHKNNRQVAQLLKNYKKRNARKRLKQPERS